MSRIVIYEEDNTWRFRVTDSDGMALAASCNVYRDREKVLTAIAELADTIEDVSAEDKDHILVEVHEIRTGGLRSLVKEIFSGKKSPKTVQIHHALRINKDGQ